MFCKFKNLILNVCCIKSNNNDVFDLYCSKIKWNNIKLDDWNTINMLKGYVRYTNILSEYVIRDLSEIINEYLMIEIIVRLNISINRIYCADLYEFDEYIIRVIIGDEYIMLGYNPITKYVTTISYSSCYNEREWIEIYKNNKFDVLEVLNEKREKLGNNKIEVMVIGVNILYDYLKK